MKPHVWVTIIVMAVFVVYLGVRNIGKVNQWDERSREIELLKKKQTELLASIQTMAGTGKCKKDYECRIIGYGPKTCDGYLKFLVYSVMGVNEPRLFSAINHYNQNAQKLHDLDLKVPNCGIKAPPVQCLQKQCIQSS